MAATIIDCKRVASEVKAEAAKLAEGHHPKLTVVTVGDDPASAAYVRGKERDCRELGFDFEQLKLSESVTQDELELELRRLSESDGDPAVILQLPLPSHLDARRAVNVVDVEKDVDGLTDESRKRLLLGESCFEPCTPAGVMRLLGDVSGKSVVVVGRSSLVGEPLAQMLMHADATVTVAHSKTADLKSTCERADVVVSAVGCPKLITADMVKPGATVIDVGISRVDGHLVGDVDFRPVSEVAGEVTTVPGGVGLMTRAMLMRNTAIASMRRS